MGVPRLWLAIPPSILFFLSFRGVYAAEGQRSHYRGCSGVTIWDIAGVRGNLYISPAGLGPVYSHISHLSTKKVDTLITGCYTYVVGLSRFVTPAHVIKRISEDKAGTHPLYRREIPC